MASPVAFDQVVVGDVLPEKRVRITRLDLVRYAGASGDFNVIHWNERVAKLVGLPDVIAHGMYTMAQAGRVVTDWVADPAALEEFGVRFTRPVPVPDDDQGAEVTFTGVVTEKLDGQRVKVNITAICGDASVLGRANAVVRLS